VEVIYVGCDDWSRNLWKSTKTGNIYVEVDGGLYDRTPDFEEPCSLIITMDKVTIIGIKEKFNG